MNRRRSLAIWTVPAPHWWDDTLRGFRAWDCRFIPDLIRPMVWSILTLKLLDHYNFHSSEPRIIRKISCSWSRTWLSWKMDRVWSRWAEKEPMIAREKIWIPWITIWRSNRLWCRLWRWWWYRLRWLGQGCKMKRILVTWKVIELEECDFRLVLW